MEIAGHKANYILVKTLIPLTAERALRALIDFTLTPDDLLVKGEPLGRERVSLENNDLILNKHQ